MFPRSFDQSTATIRCLFSSAVKSWFDTEASERTRSVGCALWQSPNRHLLLGWARPVRAWHIPFLAWVKVTQVHNGLTCARNGSWPRLRPRSSPTSTSRTGTSNITKASRSRIPLNLVSIPQISHGAALIAKNSQYFGSVSVELAMAEFRVVRKGG
jgi:hypothetical protein